LPPLDRVDRHHGFKPENPRSVGLHQPEGADFEGIPESSAATGANSADSPELLGNQAQKDGFSVLMPQADRDCSETSQKGREDSELLYPVVVEVVEMFLWRPVLWCFEDFFKKLLRERKSRA